MIQLDLFVDKIPYRGWKRHIHSDGTVEDYKEDFVHVKENNSFSQSILEANYEELNGQCRKVYDLLKSGARLTVKGAMIDYNISSLPRRILDLKKKGVDIKTELIDKKFVEYYINKKPA